MVQVDVVELADLARPDQLVAELIRQNPQMPVPVPIEALARAAGIEAIKELASETFEGSLICDDVKSRGVILFNSSRPRSRQRFTIAHELGHFLLPWQRKTQFKCEPKHLKTEGSDADWEVQASRFAADLLLPQAIFENAVQALGDPAISAIVELGQRFETSVEFTARRYAEVGGHVCAVVFSKDNVVRYFAASEFFEHRLCVRPRGPLPQRSTSRASRGDSEEWNVIESYWWLEEGRSKDLPEEVYEQTLWQENGFKVTLLTYDS